MTNFSFATKRVSGWSSFLYNATFAYAIIIPLTSVYHTEETSQEDEFANEFIKRDGVPILVDVITSSHGNTLAVCTSSRLLPGLPHLGNSTPSRQ
jgi:hypothetical protein